MRGHTQRSARAVQLVGRPAVPETDLFHTRGIIVASSVGFDASSTLGIWYFCIFTQLHPFPPLFTLFLLHHIHSFPG